MNLATVVRKYRELAGGFGSPVALSAFGFEPGEAEQAFSMLDEDYHISRFFNFSTQPGARAFRINGFDHTHVSIAAEIESAL